MTPNKSSLSKPVKRELAIAHRNQFRTRAITCWKDRNELVLDIIEAVGRGENLLLNLDPKEYCESIFEGVSESFAFRVSLQCKQLTHLPRKQLAAINEGKRCILATAFRDLGANKAKDLVEMAADSKIEVAEYQNIVKARRFAPEQHRDPLVRLAVSVEAPVADKWQRVIVVVGQALTGEDGATPTPSAIYEAISDAILPMTLPQLKQFLPAGEEVEERA